jgi:hypothetical protein
MVPPNMTNKSSDYLMNCRFIARLSVLVVMLPLLSMALVPRLVLNKTWVDFVPVGSDEIIYWQGTRTYLETGFNGGYYVYNEQLADSEIQSGPWGPAPLIYFGGIGRLIGWGFVTPIAANVAVVTAALLFLILVQRPDGKQLIVLGLVLLTFWPLHLYLGSVLQEPLHYGIAICAAVIFAVVLQRERFPVGLWGLLLSLIAIGIPFRFTWCLMLYPTLIVAVRKRGIAAIVGACVLATILCAAAMSFDSNLRAPYPFGLGPLLAEAHTPFAKLRMGLGFIYYNLTWINRGSWLDIANRYLIAGLIGWTGSTIVRQYRAATGAVWERLGQAESDLWLHLFNLGSYLGIQVLYSIYQGRDYRIIAPHLLMSLVLLVLFRRFKAVAVVAAVHLVLLPSFIMVYREFRTLAFEADQEVLTEFEELLVEAGIGFEADQSRWCNTVSVTDYNYDLLMLPPGIGISALLGVPMEELEMPLQSQYLRLWNPEYQILRTRMNLEPLVDFPYNDTVLYRNLDAGCN